MDAYLPLTLKEYLIHNTTSEPPLLSTLRQETRELGLKTQMLTGPLEGQFLSLLVRLSQAGTCLEIGTFTGYSALCIASGLAEKGKLLTLENNNNSAEIAKKYFALSQHGHKIEIKLGDAIQSLSMLYQTFDFIFLDADKVNYPHYYDLLIPKLNPHGLMVVDNALWKGLVVSPKDKITQAIDLLNQKARRDPRVETALLPIRDGMLLVYKL